MSHEVLDPMYLAELAQRVHNAMGDSLNRMTAQLAQEGVSAPAANLAAYIAACLLLDRVQVVQEQVSADTWPVVQNIVEAMSRAMLAQNKDKPTPVARA